MSRKLTVTEMVWGGLKFFTYLTRGGLFNINLEVTKRCNARCNFCDYWKEKPPEELKDYTPVVSKLNPLSVSLTGGEPLLREDLARVIASLRKKFGFLFISLVTNGSLLTVERGIELWEAGLDEFSISLDYLDERHDKERGLPGVTQHILSVAPLLRDAGVNLCFNVVLKRGNFRELPQIVQRAADMKIKVSVSTYNCWRTDNQNHMIGRDELEELKHTVAELKRLKKSLGNLTTGEGYLDMIPVFFETLGISGCTAGLNWIQVTPDGMIKRCSDQPVVGHFTQWRKGLLEATACDHCWYSCRGAAQEPMTFKRFLDMAKDALS